MSVVEFKSGDQVVYPSHGVGQVVGHEEQSVAGHNMKFYVIEFEKEKMTLRVPVGSTKAGLRALSGKDLVEKAITILKGRAKPGRGMWSRRAQEYEGKINSGNVTLIAEVVRDLHKNVDDPDRSYSERVIYEAALERLAGEYAAVSGVSNDEAIEMLIKTLRSRKVANKDVKPDDEGDVAA